MSKLISITTTAQKMKLSTEDFFIRSEVSTVSCGFGQIYRKNPRRKTSFFVQSIKTKSIKSQFESSFW